MPFKEKVPRGFMSVETYVARYRISRRTVGRMIENGELRARRGRWRWFIEKGVFRKDGMA